MSKYLEIFKNNIKRIAPTMSNYELSKLSGVSESTLSLYFKDERSPSLTKIVSIAEALKVEPAELLKNSTKRNIPVDILELLEGQSDDVYDLVRDLLTAVSNKTEHKKVK